MDIPGVTELLTDIFRSENTPERQKLQAATLLGKGGALEKVSDGLFVLLEKLKLLNDHRQLAELIRTYGTDKDKEHLATYIESLPPGAKRSVLTKER